jgi:hypothetical protein
MKPLRLLSAATAALFSVVAIAAPACAIPCFQPPDIEADQAIRYQTELMVLDDTCGGDFYRPFTVRNREQIISYQHQLKDHFRRTGAKSPDATLERFMTEIANELALRNGTELRMETCTRSAPVIAEAKTIDPEQFRTLAASLASENRTRYKTCR